ncbi:MAG: hypothetical protein AAFY60_07955 [Myxococcota bacterium]
MATAPARQEGLCAAYPLHRRAGFWCQATYDMVEMWIETVPDGERMPVEYWLTLFDAIDQNRRKTKLTGPMSPEEKEERRAHAREVAERDAWPEEARERYYQRLLDRMDH